MIGIVKTLFGLGPKVEFPELVSRGAIILDVRTKGEFASGHIRGSVNISVDQLNRNLKKLKNKNKPIITCCESGSRSGVARRILRSNGFTEVYNGGAWRSLRNKIK
ncbi:MAG TPA: rhodanese-like domain-containing protein [Sunxiuqinia sp.]|nr:rhodanese-like domain-containing protein [Sunxiuqinia sp.]